MSEPVIGFYNSLAPYYHLIFEDWEDSIEFLYQTVGAPGSARRCFCA